MSVETQLRRTLEEFRKVQNQAAALGVTPPTLQPIDIVDLFTKFPTRSPYLIDGLVRRGEIVNTIAGSKDGKTWFTYGMLLSLATGSSWLDFPTTKSRCLLIDNELKQSEISHRLHQVAIAANASNANLKGCITVWPARGFDYTVDRIESDLSLLPVGTFDLIAIDAFYRIFPPGISENDNAAVTQIYNRLNAIASKHDTTIVIVHHSTKGQQGGKSVTDVGSGAGAISRAADTHLVIRPHTQDGLAVLDAVTRSSPKPASRSIRFNFPLWELDASLPEIKQATTKIALGQATKDVEAQKLILDALKECPNALASTKYLTTACGMGADRVTRNASMLVSRSILTRTLRPNPKQPDQLVPFYSLTPAIE